MKKISWRTLFFSFWLIVGAVYVSHSWSPSSYAYALSNHYGYQDISPTLGKPRSIRADEWAVVTPLTQATVRNQFERYNKTSLYEEDLRINYGLPIADWGIAFKPTMWLYGLINPAYAYSFHWFAIFALFIGGYAFLFKKFGASDAVAAMLSFGLYFTGFSQFWWNEKGPLIAIFPWTIIPFFLNIRLSLQLIWFYYAAVFWLLTNFYPPIQISLAFVGLVVLIAKQPHIFRLRTLVWVLIAAALAAGTAGLYLYDYLSVTSSTIYPGSRHSMGGGVPIRFIVSWFLPAINFSWIYNSLIGINICEIGTVGMYYYAAVLFFLNYGNYGQLWSDASRRRVFIVLLTGLVIQLLWITIPIPYQFGKILLWDHVEPARMQYASGVLLTLVILYTANTIGLEFSLKRLVLFSASILAGWAVFKYPFGAKRMEDLLFVFVLIAIYIAARKKAILHHESIALASLIFGAIIFGRFNPLQSAWPIFNIQPNEVVKYLQEQETKNNNILVFPHLHGATANGLGFRSLSHTTAVPQMAFWRKNFPELSSDELNHAFNRYSHIMPDLIPSPFSQQPDAVQVPIDRFTKVDHAIAVSGYPDNIKKIGGFSIEKQYPTALLISGWGAWESAPEFHAIEIMSRPQIIGKAEVTPIIRPDLPLNTGGVISSLNGFKLLIPTLDKKPFDCLSLIALDRKTQIRTLLENPGNLPPCETVSP